MIFSNEIVLFAYQGVKTPNEIMLGLISTKSDKIGFKVLCTVSSSQEMIKVINKEKEKLDICFCTTNSLLISRFIRDGCDHLPSKTFKMFLNNLVDETDRILRYSVFTKNIIGTERSRVETLKLGVNLTIQDTTSVGYLVDYSSIKTYTLALMDYIYYRTMTANIDKISNLNT